ncbi:phosphonate ABC transporter ATP-binding protein [Effusibacillus dendaii]|uniref:Phosphonates import ATP-binding protein PhnC n=1 Tax=Effusibacillus dendaii TaxID=2743772 RepID=A0A7I8DD89_9BACL|nr:phosphonate ABC transporter ATP-binding protein [Effusibacillus dendaii]BCJ87987.1 phosphonates import ATP-binding protein PhnC [Effusibacillus dendaii]
MLIIQDLKKKYAKSPRPALDGINLTVEKGEFIAVLGLSGAGKSTLIRCINQLVLPTSGEILWHDQPVLGKRGKALRAYRRQVGMIFQNFNLIDRLSVLQNVLAGRFGTTPMWRVLLQQYTREDLQIAEEALLRVGMVEFKRVRADQLSGGQRQRVAIARALAQKPELILGDEPISNLDPVTAVDVMELLKSINEKEGITMILNLHSVEIAVQYANRIIGIANGQVVYDGSPEGLSETVLAQIYKPDRKVDPAVTTKAIKLLSRI